MKITKDQWKKIEEINEKVKSLDPVLKERVIDFELGELLGDDYKKILANVRKTEIQKESGRVLEQSVTSLTQEENRSMPTIKEYFHEKNPATSVETVAVFGFYLEHYENKEEFTEEDVAKAYFDARVRKPKVISQSLRDAKNTKGYLVEGSGRGRFRLSNLGENLVLHDLPRKS